MRDTCAPTQHHSAPRLTTPVHQLSTMPHHISRQLCTSSAPCSTTSHDTCAPAPHHAAPQLTTPVHQLSTMQRHGSRQLCTNSAPCSATAHDTCAPTQHHSARRLTTTVHQLRTMQRHGSHHSLNVPVHDIYRENIRQTSHCKWRIGVKSTSHAGGLGLFFHGGRGVDSMCFGRQWSLDRDAVDYLTYLQ